MLPLALAIALGATPASARTFNFNSAGSMVQQPLSPQWACAMRRAMINRRIPCRESAVLRRQGGSAAGDAPHNLHNAVNSSFEASLAKLKANSSSATAAGSLTAAAIAGTNFIHFQSHARDAMNAGALSTSLGVKLIANALDDTLTALGAETLPVQAIEHQEFLQKLGVDRTGPDSQFNP
jgi:hypothetical protein